MVRFYVKNSVLNRHQPSQKAARKTSVPDTVGAHGLHTEGQHGFVSWGTEARFDARGLLSTLAMGIAMTKCP